MSRMVICMNISRSSDDIIGFICAKEKETSDNNFIAEYIQNKTSIHIFVNSSEKFMIYVLNFYTV